MKVKIISGDNATELEEATNAWLKKEEKVLGVRLYFNDSKLYSLIVYEPEVESEYERITPSIEGELQFPSGTMAQRIEEYNLKQAVAAEQLRQRKRDKG